MKNNERGQTLSEAEIQRGNFQGDSPFPLIFDICTISLPSVYRKTKSSCIIDNMKTNSLLFMEDLFRTMGQ